MMLRWFFRAACPLGCFYCFDTQKSKNCFLRTKFNNAFSIHNNFLVTLFSYFIASDIKTELMDKMIKNTV